MIVRSISICALLAVLAVGLACSNGGDDSPDVITATPGDVAAGTPNPPSGQVFEHLEGQLPATFPNDFPIYEGVEIARGDTLGDRYALDMRSPDDIDTVTDFYRSGLATAPWELVEEEPGEGSTVFAYRSADGAYNGEVAIGKLQERTWILVAMEKPE